MTTHRLSAALLSVLLLVSTACGDGDGDAAAGPTSADDTEGSGADSSDVGARLLFSADPLRATAETTEDDSARFEYESDGSGRSFALVLEGPNPLDDSAGAREIGSDPEENNTLHPTTTNIHLGSGRTETFRAHLAGDPGAAVLTFIDPVPGSGYVSMWQQGVWTASLLPLREANPDDVTETTWYGVGGASSIGPFRFLPDRTLDGLRPDGTWDLLDGELAVVAPDSERWDAGLYIVDHPEFGDLLIMQFTTEGAVEEFVFVATEELCLEHQLDGPTAFTEAAGCG